MSGTHTRTGGAKERVSMISDSDKAFIERVDQGLAAGWTWEQIAEAEGMPLGTLYGRVRALGYKAAKRLVPINAPALNGQEQAA